jgi:hypothetical protein
MRRSSSASRLAGIALGNLGSELLDDELLEEIDDSIGGDAHPCILEG